MSEGPAIGQWPALDFSPYQESHMRKSEIVNVRLKDGRGASIAADAIDAVVDSVPRGDGCYIWLRGGARLDVEDSGREVLNNLPS